MSISDTDDTFESVGIDFWEDHPTIPGHKRQVYAGVSIVCGPFVNGFSLKDKWSDEEKVYSAATEEQAVRILRCIRPTHFWDKEPENARTQRRR